MSLVAYACIDCRYADDGDGDVYIVVLGVGDDVSRPVVATVITTMMIMMGNLRPSADSCNPHS